MSPIELVKATYTHLDQKLKYLNNDIKTIQHELDEKLDELEALDKLLDQYHEFIRKSEDAIDVIGGSDSGFCVESTTKEL